MYAQVISTASEDGGPAGRSAARGNSPDGPYCIDPSSRPSESWYTVPQAPHSSSAFWIHRLLSTVRDRDCHQMHLWQTDGAVSRVAPLSPLTRGGTRGSRRRSSSRRGGPRARCSHGLPSTRF